MNRVLLSLVILVAAVGTALAQQPAPPPRASDAQLRDKAGSPVLSPEAFSRLQVLELERQVLSLQQQNLEKDYREIRRQLAEKADGKAREVVEAIADEAAKAKVDPKTHRPDFESKTWVPRGK